MKIDFHVHTTASMDSTISPKALAAKAARLGVIPVVADHNSTGSHAAMRALAARFIPAEEVFTDKGDLVCLYANEPIPKGTPFLEAIDRIHGQGGLACIPHMFDYGRSGRHAGEAEASKADIIEAFNARCMRKEYNGQANAFAEKYGLPKAAGSDSHFLFEFGSTYADLPSLAPDDLGNPKSLLSALRSRDARLVTRKAPFFVRGTTTLVATARRIMRAVRR
jgi:predicted metal-dependent phosphoesterase TrpH